MILLLFYLLNIKSDDIYKERWMEKETNKEKDVQTDSCRVAKRDPSFRFVEQLAKCSSHRQSQNQNQNHNLKPHHPYGVPHLHRNNPLTSPSPPVKYLKHSKILRHRCQTRTGFVLFCLRLFSFFCFCFFFFFPNEKVKGVCLFSFFFNFLSLPSIPVR